MSEYTDLEGRTYNYPGPVVPLSTGGDVTNWPQYHAFMRKLREFVMPTREQLAAVMPRTRGKQEMQRITHEMEQQAALEEELKRAAEKVDLRETDDYEDPDDYEEDDFVVPG